jgi:DNA-binding response OmpR family regulator
VVPRVLVVHERPDGEDVEWHVAPDGQTAVDLLARERFDSVVLDLALPPLDGWYVLAAIGPQADRPRVIARLRDRADVERARRLGADLCVLAGTHLHARAFQSPWRQHPKTNCPRPTTSGVPA